MSNIIHVPRSEITEADGEFSHVFRLLSVCSIPAKNPDVLSEAFALIKEWRDEYSDNPNTHRAFQKESDRFVIWMYMYCPGKRLTEVNKHDIEAYRSFLAAPDADMCYGGGKPPRQNHPDWRPFSGPLKPSSITAAMQILRSLYEYLCDDAEVMHRSPFKAKRISRKMKQARIQQEAADQDNVVEFVLWEDALKILRKTVKELPDDTEELAFRRARAVFLIEFAVSLAPRISEIHSACMGHIGYGKGRKVWWRVVGKGGKIMDVPVSRKMIRAFSDWRYFLGLSGMPDRSDQMPMVPGMDLKTPLSTSSIYAIIKKLGLMASRNAKPGSIEEKQLLNMSPHWLRHTSITNATRQGVDPRMVQIFARHSRRETTEKYTHTEEDELHSAFNELK